MPSNNELQGVFIPVDCTSTKEWIRNNERSTTPAVLGNKEIGCNTKNGWKNTHITGGNVDSSTKKIFVNYTKHPCYIRAIPLSGDFNLKIKLGVDYLGAYGYFGLTTSLSNISPEIRINQNNLNGNISINNVFTIRNQTETIRIKRMGSTYTYVHNNEVKTFTVESPQTVYFFIEKSGNGSIFLESIEYSPIEYITSVRDGNTDYFTACNTVPLARNMTIITEMYLYSQGTLGYGLMKIETNTTNKFFVFDGGTPNFQETHSGNGQSDVPITKLPVGLTTMLWEIDSDGYVNYQDSNGNNKTSQVAFTDSELATMQFVFKHWGDDKIFDVRSFLRKNGSASGVIADALSLVSNGEAETDDLHYTTGHDITSFRPGQTYDIAGKFFAEGYELVEDVATLSMPKIFTTLTISGNNTVIRNQTMNIQCTIKENYSNTYLNRGTIILKENNVEVARTNVNNGQNVVIPYIPTTMGTKTLQATYLDSGTEYNSSLSNELSVEVESSFVWQYPQSIEQSVGETVHLEGRVLDGNTPLNEGTIILRYGDNTVRDSLGNVIYASPNNGYFSFDFPMQSYYNGVQVRFYYTNGSMEPETKPATTLYFKKLDISRIDVSPNNLSVNWGASGSFTFTTYDENDEVTITNGINLDFFEEGLEPNKIYCAEVVQQDGYWVAEIPFQNRPTQYHSLDTIAELRAMNAEPDPTDVIILTLPDTQTLEDAIQGYADELFQQIDEGNMQDQRILDELNWGNLLYNAGNSEKPFYINLTPYPVGNCLGFFVDIEHSDDLWIEDIMLQRYQQTFYIQNNSFTFDYSDSTPTPVLSKSLPSSYSNGSGAYNISFISGIFNGDSNYEMVVTHSSSSTLNGEYMTSVSITVNSTG